MATEDEKQYELKHKVVYGMYIDEQLTYVGVATANIENIFVGLYKESVRGIVMYPKELKKFTQDAKFEIIHIMADNQNTCEENIAMARLLSNQSRPVHPFRTKHMYAMFLHLALRGY